MFTEKKTTTLFLDLVESQIFSVIALLGAFKNVVRMNYYDYGHPFHLFELPNLKRISDFTVKND